MVVLVEGMLDWALQSPFVLKILFVWCFNDCASC
jgi:hypothetical protein